MDRSLQPSSHQTTYQIGQHQKKYPVLDSKLLKK